METYNLRVNGFARTVESDDPEKPLLYALRDLGLTATKYGCGLGQCGSCTVIIDGKAVRSCRTSVQSTRGKSVTTLEGLSADAALHPVQAAFIKEQAAQCGYCTSGVLISAAALLAKNPRPAETEVRAALDRNLCRCGSHNRMVRAVLRAATET